LGELGHGTCGVVHRMKHKDTGVMMAVKVNRGRCSRQFDFITHLVI